MQRNYIKEAEELLKSSEAFSYNFEKVREVEKNLALDYKDKPIAYYALSQALRIKNQVTSEEWEDILDLGKQALKNLNKTIKKEEKPFASSTEEKEYTKKPEKDKKVKVGKNQQTSISEDKIKTELTKPKEDKETKTENAKKASKVVKKEIKKESKNEKTYVSQTIFGGAQSSNNISKTKNLKKHSKQKKEKEDEIAQLKAHPLWEKENLKKFEKFCQGGYFFNLEDYEFIKEYINTVDQADAYLAKFKTWYDNTIGPASKTASFMSVSSKVDLKAAQREIIDNVYKKAIKEKNIEIITEKDRQDVRKIVNDKMYELFTNYILNNQNNLTGTKGGANISAKDGMDKLLEDVNNIKHPGINPIF